MQFEHSLYLAHERLLFLLSPVEPLAPLTGAALLCDGKRFLGRLQLFLGALTAASLALLIALHATHVGKPGCFGAVAEAAARSWSSGANGTGDFFRQDDVFRLRIDFAGSAASAALWGPPEGLSYMEELFAPLKFL